MKRKLLAALITGLMLTSSVTAYASDVTMTDGTGQGNTTVTGTISAVTTMDITIPVGGINFAIDSDGNITSQGIVIQSNTAVPISVEVLSAEALEAGDTSKGLTATTTNAPELVPVNTYTAEQWNNLTRAETLEKIALSIKQVDVVDGSASTSLTEATTDTLKVTTPVQLGSLAENSKLAHLESGYGSASKIGINLETDSAYTNYGKAWVNENDVTFRYLTTLEFSYDSDSAGN